MPSLTDMLPRKYRLTADKDIERAFKRGRSLHVGGFSIRFARNGLEVSRFAFVVGTKTAKKAVVRNRLKRQMREAVHAHLGDLKPGYDVVVGARKEAVGREYAEIAGALSRLLAKAHLLEKSDR